MWVPSLTCDNSNCFKTLPHAVKGGGSGARPTCEPPAPFGIFSFCSANAPEPQGPQANTRMSGARFGEMMQLWSHP